MLEVNRQTPSKVTGQTPSKVTGQTSPAGNRTQGPVTKMSQNNRTDGIVITTIAVVRYSPSFSGAVALKLTEGTTVEVIRHYNDWKHIRLNKSQSGWVTDDMVEEI